MTRPIFSRITLLTRTSSKGHDSSSTVVVQTYKIANIATVSYMVKNIFYTMVKSYSDKTKKRLNMALYSSTVVRSSCTFLIEQ